MSSTPDIMNFLSNIDESKWKELRTKGTEVAPYFHWKEKAVDPLAFQLLCNIKTNKKYKHCVTTVESQG